MKSQKLLLIAAIVCLLVGASGAAMAETLTDCGDGSINGGTYDGIVLTEYEDCVIVGVTVVGAVGVRVRNPRLFSMINSFVKNGNVLVRRDDKSLEPSTATIVNNVVQHGNIEIRELDEADVRRNTVGDGNIRVIDSPSLPDQYAEVIQNKINGNLRVDNNLSANVKENTTIGGDITCRGNQLLFAPCNEAVQGTVRCSRDLFPGE